MTVKSVPYGEEGEVPITGRLIIYQKEKKLIKDETNIMVYSDIESEGAEERVP